MRTALEGINPTTWLPARRSECVVRVFKVKRDVIPVRAAAILVRVVILCVHGRLQFVSQDPFTHPRIYLPALSSVPEETGRYAPPGALCSGGTVRISRSFRLEMRFLQRN